MAEPVSNIEAVARAICERDLRRGGIVAEDEMPAHVDRYWHCIAADLEAGIIDESGNTVSRDVEEGLAAYRDWRARHPSYTPPPLPHSG